MSRMDDTVRPHRTHRTDTSNEIKDPAYTRTVSPNNGPPVRDEVAARPHKSTPSKLLAEDLIIELAQRAVDSGLQDTRRSLAGSEAVDDVVRPKLTIDLGHANIARVPEAVVNIIKDEVARLSLSNNHIDRIPNRFSECVHLRYLNIRANNFTEFPRVVYSLTFLEILDLSRNKITKLPEEVRNLSSLRVFSIMQNFLEDLPSQLSDMSKLQVIKVSGNPLNSSLKAVLELREADVNHLDMADNEKDSAITTELKRFLKSRQAAASPEPEYHDPSETTEPPKPPKRGNRFPVIPRSSNGTESTSGSRSPSLSRPPPIPTRSHHRMASGQSGLIHRSNTSASVSERNRSNSEGFIVSSAASRNKRMGLISRKNTDLGTLDEMRPYRNSHLRGLSHGSLLRSQRGGIPNDGSNSSSPSSPRDRRRLKDGFVHRLSSLPEQRVKTTTKNPVIISARSVLYALYQIHPHISSLINVIKAEEYRRSSLEIVFYNATTHLDQLNEALQSIADADLQDKEIAKRVTEAVKHECATCITAYTHVGTQLRVNVSKAVALSDPKYVRSLLLMIYGSLIELRNACAVFNVKPKPRKPKTAKKLSITTTNQPMSRFTPEREPEPSVTPTRDRHPPTRRLRSETTVHLPPFAPFPTALPPFAPHPTGIPSHSNHPTVPPLAIGGRSRSSSRSNAFLHSSGTSSIANTPRSGESFNILSTPVNNRINPITGLDEIEEDRIFERIFIQLSSAYKAALQAVPLAARQFSQCLEAAEASRAPQHLRNLCRKLLIRCRSCVDVADALDSRLSNMKLKEPGGGLRNQREFWHLCKTFIQTFVELVLDIREAKTFCLLPSEIVATLRIVQKTIREAGRLIDTSPWSYLAELHTSNPSNPSNAVSQHQSNGNLHYSNSSTSIASQSSLASGSSPQSATMPATPLSAALGPAAQATVPSTAIPASATSDRMFAGDVFQRADLLLSMAPTAPLFYRR
ncbi:RAM signaling pathway protein domain-containing protein [Arthroderma uncinatum]|uniref:RAM signaling pathway protein domain-containing protein n=1 Tax=Arthroderma uncinatum TaxID=74035 RepID=UPI00144ABA80|nr:RAM signaling pathway protein domain-containing protein [Arthroderma uncinatum]KAF3491880.1 RAM signaling pathway protein domain-containing protein [Arthroderma uncinatum]